MNTSTNTNLLATRPISADEVDRYIDRAKRLRAEAFAAMLRGALRLPARAFGALRAPRRGRYVAAH